MQIGQDYYRQVIGIPQGSVLSSILCAFFYGDLEKKFKLFTEDPGSVRLPCFLDGHPNVGLT